MYLAEIQLLFNASYIIAFSFIPWYAINSIYCSKIQIKRVYFLLYYPNMQDI